MSPKNVKPTDLGDSQEVIAMKLALSALEWMSDVYVGDDDDAGECASCHERSYKPHAPDCEKNNAIIALRSVLNSIEKKKLHHQ